MDLDSQPSSRGFRQAFLYLKRILIKSSKRRQGGYGRGASMKSRADRVEITSGVRHGLTMGGPITLNVTNLDHQKMAGDHECSTG